MSWQSWRLAKLNDTIICFYFTIPCFWTGTISATLNMFELQKNLWNKNIKTIYIFNGMEGISILLLLGSFILFPVFIPILKN